MTVRLSSRAYILIASGGLLIALVVFSRLLFGAGSAEVAISADDREAQFSSARQINPATIGRLGLAWSLDLPGEQSLEAVPVEADGLLYVTGSASRVYAADARTGRLAWMFDPEISKHSPERMRLSFAVNRGVAVSGGRVFLGAFDGRLFALDARTGRVLWNRQTLEESARSYITGAPRLFGGKVIIGFGGGDYGTRGYVTAYDQQTGRRVWRFHTTPGAPDENAGDPVMEKAARTWSGEYWKTGTGGAVWNGITFDPELNRVYIGTSNGSPYDPRQRSPGGGDNLFLASIIALDAETGRYIWHYQVNPREAWDYKATANMVVATLIIDGRARRVLMQAPTNGFYYVLDRETGKLILAGKTGKINWAERIDIASGRPVEAPNIRYETGEVTIFPGPHGGHNWQPMAYSPLTRLAYIPYQQIGARFSNNGKGGGEGAVTFGGFSIAPVVEGRQDGKGALIAWDPVAQKARWTVWYPMPWNGGVLATGGGVVFQGRYDGLFDAYDAADGRKLWSFDAQQGIVGAPTTYTIDGRQYVSVLAGTGGSVPPWSSVYRSGWRFESPTRRLLTFALDGQASLPPGPGRTLGVTIADVPGFVVDPVRAAAGEGLFTVHCSKCHGTDALGAGSVAPDLRESALPGNPDSFATVVRGGVLASSGMPRFDDLTDGQLDALRHYIRSRANLERKRQEAARR